MSCWYLWIKAMQEPMDGDLDDVGRSVVFFNIRSYKKPSATFLREILGLLQTAGIGVVGKTLLASSQAALGSTGTIIIVRATGGAPPQLTQNSPGVTYQQATAQIRVHAKKYEDADAKARAAYDALTVVRNQNVDAA
jgi:hypothetical protein